MFMYVLIWSNAGLIYIYNRDIMSIYIDHFYEMLIYIAYVDCTLPMNGIHLPIFRMILWKALRT